MRSTGSVLASQAPTTTDVRSPAAMNADARRSMMRALE